MLCSHLLGSKGWNKFKEEGLSVEICRIPVPPQRQMAIRVSTSVASLNLPHMPSQEKEVRRGPQVGVFYLSSPLGSFLKRGMRWVTLRWVKGEVWGHHPL